MKKSYLSAFNIQFDHKNGDTLCLVVCVDSFTGCCHVESADLKESLKNFRAKCYDTWAAAIKKVSPATFCGVPKVAHLQTKQVGLNEETHVLNLFLSTFGCFSPNMHLFFFLSQAKSPLEEPKSRNISLFFCWHDWLLGRTHVVSFCPLMKYSQGNSTLNVNITRNNRHSIALSFFAEGPLWQTAMEKCYGRTFPQVFVGRQDKFPVLNCSAVSIWYRRGILKAEDLIASLVRAWS